jgi:FixJ family two-component response regulator
VGVLFTDFDMPPGMNGLKLASLIRDRFPVMPIIIASGHKEVVADQMPTGSEFLTKPYSIDQVIAAILRLSR